MALLGASLLLAACQQSRVMGLTIIPQTGNRDASEKQASPKGTPIPTFPPTLPPAQPDMNEPQPLDDEIMTADDDSSLRITILYDNNPYDERLQTAWGFSAFVENKDHHILFDTGGDGPTLLSNMQALGIAPESIEAVVLSHAHSDHTGGLASLLALGIHPDVYLPPSFPEGFKNEVAEMTHVTEVSPGQSIVDGIYTIGEMPGAIPEQALVVKSDQGLIVITGCAHPGIVEIVGKAELLFGEPVFLVMGGFHLKDANHQKVDEILRAFRRLGVEKVAPCHCSGDSAIELFAAEYQEDFIRAGAGKVIVIANDRP